MLCTPLLQFSFWQKLSPQTRGSVLVFLGALSISFGPLIIKTIETSATTAAFYRMLFGGSALLLFAIIKREALLPSRFALLATAIAGSAFCGDLFFWHRSILLVGPGLATILANFQVFVLAILGVLFFGEKPSLRLFGSILLAFTGLILLLELQLSTLNSQTILGIAYGLITSLFLTCYLLALRQSRRVQRPLQLVPNMALVSLICAGCLGAVALVEGAALTPANGTDAILLALYGIGCQAVGWLMVSAGLPHLAPGRAGLLLMAEPLCAFMWDILFLGRPTGILGYCGAFLTIAAIYTCFYKGKYK